MKIWQMAVEILGYRWITGNAVTSNLSAPPEGLRILMHSPSGLQNLGGLFLPKAAVYHEIHPRKRNQSMPKPCGWR